MKYSNINQITENEIRILIQEQVQENTHLEYKREIKFSNDREKKELLADVCSFANSGGGIILYGIEEEKSEDGKNTGAPKQITGLLLNIDEAKRSLDESIKRSIEPVLIGLNINSIKVDNKTLLVIFIPHNSSPPHRVTFKGSNKFWKRANVNKYEIPIEELRHDFLKGAELSKRISVFRSERITKILSNDTPVLLQEGPTSVLHIIPVNFFDKYQFFNSFNQFDISAFQPTGTFSGYHSLNKRLNFDGYVTYDLTGGKHFFCYTQVFRNATVEVVSKFISDNNFLKLQHNEINVIRVLQLYCASLVKKHISGPCIILFSLLNIKGYTVHNDSQFMQLEQVSLIDRNNLLLPDVYIEDINNFSAPDLMKPVFDMVWNACGYPGSKNYDGNGKWKSTY